jgi:hypothetical protein
MDTGYIPQDTIKPSLVLKIDAGRLIPDSAFRALDEKPAHILKAEKEMLRKRVYLPADIVRADSTSTCSRNAIADVTFADSAAFIRNIRLYRAGSIPFRFTSRSGTEPGQYRPMLIHNLREGAGIAVNRFHHDGVTILVFFSFWLFLLVRSTIRSMRPEITRFFLFRGINEPASRDINTLFYWQSTVFNFIAFLVLSLFAYTAALYFDVVPPGFSPLLAVIILFGIFSVSVTVRHLVCLSAGNLSGQQEAFNEYLLNIYQSYRFSSGILFVVILLTLYTYILPASVSITAGIGVIMLFYIYRVIRLILIFLKRHISIYYLILYLCALEILPMLILVKYFTTVHV